MPSSVSPALTFTGERFAPEVRGSIWYEHWHRYCAVRPLVRGQRVLDAACGEGYGSFLLADGAREVIGVDIAAEAVAHARARYVAGNLRYVEASCTALPLPDASVDRIVSFETIEHLPGQVAMLAEFRRVLAPDGVLVISSPNRPVYSGSEPGGGNEFHVRELDRAELAALLDPVFPQQRWYAQRVLAHSVLWAERADSNGMRASSLLSLVGDAIIPAAEPAPPMYYVVVCAAPGVALPALPELSLFDDGEQSLYRDYTRALLREKQLAWAELDARKIAEDRLAELIAVVNALAAERMKTAELAGRLAALEASHAVVVAELEAERAMLAETRSELAQVRADYGDTRSRLAQTAGELTRAQAGLVQQGAALAEVQARLAFRETLVGWLRWPLARLRAQLAS